MIGLDSFTEARENKVERLLGSILVRDFSGAFQFAKRHTIGDCSIFNLLSVL